MYICFRGYSFGAESQHVAEGIPEKKSPRCHFFKFTSFSCGPLHFRGPRKGFFGTPDKYSLYAFQTRSREKSSSSSFSSHTLPLSYHCLIVAPRAIAAAFSSLILLRWALIFLFSFASSPSARSSCRLVSRAMSASVVFEQTPGYGFAEKLVPRFAGHVAHMRANFYYILQQVLQTWRVSRVQAPSSTSHPGRIEQWWQQLHRPCWWYRLDLHCHVLDSVIGWAAEEKEQNLPAQMFSKSLNELKPSKR